MTSTTAGWVEKASELAEELRTSGESVTAEWLDTVRSVPRHELVPCFYVQNADATWRSVGGERDTDEWLAAVYSDQTLVTAVGADHTAMSSSTMPSLVVAMLEELRLEDGCRVLEIGTGSGYNAALLSHRLGSSNVYSVDVDAEFVDRARERLTRIGYTPTLVARDGVEGLAEHAPFDRIISTCAVPAIPQAWIEQTTENGLILTDYKPSLMAGNLVALTRQGDSAWGWFRQSWAGFLPMRHGASTPTPAQPRRDHTTARERHTTAPAQPWDHPVPWFLAALIGLPPHLTYGWTAGTPNGGADTWMSTPDGSWCEVAMHEAADGTRRVLEAGPTPLWRRIEQAFDLWRTTGQPEWSRFALTVTPGRHTVWLDDPDGDHRWPLPQGRTV